MHRKRKSYPRGDHDQYAAKLAEESRILADVTIDHETAKQEAARLFEKVFDYGSDPEWTLAQNVEFLRRREDERESRTAIKLRLMSAKEKLIATKTELNDSAIEEWRRFTNSTHRGGRVINDVRRRCCAELPTQAWCKFREILVLIGDSIPVDWTSSSSSFFSVPHDINSISTDLRNSSSSFNDFPYASIQFPDSSPDRPPSESSSTFLTGPASNNAQLETFHLCEAPGAFIASLNHYLLNRDYRGDWHWTANTMNPYHEAEYLDKMINDDRLIYNTLSRWEFGPSNVGDIMDPLTLKALIRRVNRASTDDDPDGLHPPTPFGTDGDLSFGVHLVTADGSVSCANDPAEQESTVASLHWCEAVAAFSILKKGGSLVLKMFTLFEDSSICLLYLLNSLFKRVRVVKPATSKAGNSECYVLAEVFNDRLWLSLLANFLRPHYGLNLASQAVSLILNLVPESFMKRHFECVETFKNWQTSHIEENIELHAKSFRSPSEFEAEMNRVRRVQIEVSRLFFARARLKAISRDHHLAPTRVVSPAHSISPHNSLEGSYNQRREEALLPWTQRIKTVIPKDYTKVAIPFSASWVRNYEQTPSPALLCHFRKNCFIYGSRCDTVNNSLFIDPQSTRDWHLAVDSSSFQSRHIYGVDSMTVSNINDKFVDEYSKYFTKSTNLFEYILPELSELADWQVVERHRSFLNKGGQVIYYFSCVDFAAVSAAGGLSLEESTSPPLMLSLLRRLFGVDGACPPIRGSHLLLHLPPIMSRFSACFVNFVASYFDVWSLGTADNLVDFTHRCEFEEDLERCGSSLSYASQLPSFFFFGASFRLDRGSDKDDVALKAAKEFVTALEKNVTSGIVQTEDLESNEIDSNSVKYKPPDLGVVMQDLVRSAKRSESFNEPRNEETEAISDMVVGGVTNNTPVKNTSFSRAESLSVATTSMLTSITPEVSNSADERFHLLQFLPLDKLSSPSFLCHLRSTNAALMQKRLNFLIELERTVDEASKGLSEKKPLVLPE